MFLIVGLGNPGARYDKTRHNVGFMLVDRMAAAFALPGWSRQQRSLTCRLRLGAQEILLAKPQTFMNLSGEAILDLIRYHPIEADRLLIVYDEVALPLGKIRLRRSGSSGGHKGMESIIHRLGTAEIPRLRIGVAGAVLPENLSDYVLSNFSDDEREALEPALERAVEAIQSAVEEGLETAMSRHNR